MLLLLASVFLTAQGAGKDLRNLSVVRFDFDNDVFLGKDNAFTAGWSLQVLSRLNDVWGRGLAKWIGRLPFTVHVTHDRYYRQGRSGIAGSSNWINLSFEYRF